MSSSTLADPAEVMVWIENCLKILEDFKYCGSYDKAGKLFGNVQTNIFGDVGHYPEWAKMVVSLQLLDSFQQALHYQNQNNSQLRCLPKECFSKVVLSALNWYLRYQLLNSNAIEYGWKYYCENYLPNSDVVTNPSMYPFWLFPESYAKKLIDENPEFKRKGTTGKIINKLLYRSSNAKCCLTTFLTGVESKIKSFADLIVGFDREGEENVVTWSWFKIGSLNELWPYFYFESLPSSTIKFDIQLMEESEKQRMITHATSAENFIKIMNSINAKTGNDAIHIKGRPSDCQYTSPSFVWTSVCLREDEIKKVPEYYQKHFNGEGINRYGSVMLTFPLLSVVEESLACILGTRKYREEFSQVMYIPSMNESSATECYLMEARGANKLEIVDLETYKWSLAYDSTSQVWTHPELAFFKELRIPLKDVRVSFVPHLCRERKIEDCADCKNNIRPLESYDKVIKSFKSKYLLEKCSGSEHSFNQELLGPYSIIKVKHTE